MRGDFPNLTFFLLNALVKLDEHIGGTSCFA
jgi:hypothetical protein